MSENILSVFPVYRVDVALWSDEQLGDVDAGLAAARLAAQVHAHGDLGQLAG